MAGTIMEGLSRAPGHGNLGEHLLGGVDEDHDLKLSKADQPPTDSNSTPETSPALN
jgi:hypothetical protein